MYLAAGNKLDNVTKALLEIEIAEGSSFNKNCARFVRSETDAKDSHILNSRGSCYHGCT